jgi:hypothetical protein
MWFASKKNDLEVFASEEALADLGRANWLGLWLFHLFDFQSVPEALILKCFIFKPR